MQLGANADGALLQHALEGRPVDDPEIVPLVAVVREVEALDSSGLAPRGDFVAELRQRLLDEPAAGAPGGPVGDTSHDGANRGPAVVRFGRRSRILVAAAAVLLLVAGGIGALSRSALPGDTLYPVKQLLDRVALEFQRELLELGLTHLAQAREHVADTEQLIVRAQGSAAEAARDGAAPETDSDPGQDADLTTALDAATQSSTDGHSVLLDAYRTLRDGKALTALADYYAEVVPAVDALRDRPLPRAAAVAWQRLHDVLARDSESTLRELAACTVCGDASARARSLLARETATPASLGTTASGATSTPTSSSAPAPRSSTITRAPAGSGKPGSTRDSGGSGAASSSPAGSVRLPTVGVTSTGVSAGGGGVTLPGATVSLPGVGVNTSGATVGGGGVTLPGATVSVPTVTVPLPDPLP